MFKNSAKLLFLMIMMMSTIIAISSNSWINAWMGLEINLMSFIPLMINYKNSLSTESSLKYFLTQVIASILLLMFIIISFLNINIINQFYNLSFNMEYSFIIISLMIKSGAAPLHFWFPSVMEGISWMNCSLLMIWQKIAPLMLISYNLIFMMNFKNMMMMFFIIMSISIGALMGLNQTSLQKIMAFSSINHLGWMFSSMIMNENLWLIYFFFYSILSFIMIFFFYSMKLFFINNINFMMNNNLLKFMLLLNLLSLGGLPPFMGFIPKWLVIQSLIFNNFFLLILLLIFMSLITLFFYIRISFSTFMLNSSNFNWKNKIKCKNINLILLLIFSFFSFTSIMILINFMFLIF